jgi:tRNA pseudouridine38-40 synthase
MLKYPSSRIKVIGASRTDAGVHANGQVVNFDLPIQIDERGVLMGVNSILPPDIKIKAVNQVDDSFNSRFNTIGKRYYYRINTEQFADPITVKYTGSYGYQVDIEKIRFAANDLVGEHDFASFAAAGNQTKTTVRTVNYIEVLDSRDIDSEIRIVFEGNAFLYNQIRIMVGALLEIGSGQRDVNSIPEIIAAKNRDLVRFTAPASGLYLDEVIYD